MAFPNEPAGPGNGENKKEEPKIASLTFKDFKRAKREFIQHLHPERNPEHRDVAELLLRIVNQIAGDKDEQLAYWVGSHGPDDRKQYYLLRHTLQRDEDGVFQQVAGPAELSPEPITLPETPEQFVRAYKCFVEGGTWDEVKRQLAYLPDGLQPRRRFRTTEGDDVGTTPFRDPNDGRGLDQRLYTEFAQVQRLDDLPDAIRDLVAKNPRRENAVKGAASIRATVICKDMFDNVKTLKDVAAIKKQVEAFFFSAGQGLIMTPAIDFVDGWALNHIRERMKRARPAELAALMKEVNEYDFEMGDLTTQPLKQDYDARARDLFITMLKGRNARESLDQLEAEARNFTFEGNSGEGEDFKAKLLDWIDRKKKIIEHREKIGWK